MSAPAAPCAESPHGVCSRHRALPLAGGDCGPLTKADVATVTGIAQDVVDVGFYGDPIGTLALAVLSLALDLRDAHADLGEERARVLNLLRYREMDLQEIRELRAARAVAEAASVLAQRDLREELRQEREELRQAREELRAAARATP